ncbi:hypothetical protein ABZX92_20975 [Lentzea sp. NPDC006480]|uniref:hypothetical protein n=1 Tax=Lentzea sp. NPDC006480 TaxID=3157176 RepID=UPI0033A48031
MSLRFAPDGPVTPAAAPLGLRLKRRGEGKGIVTMSTGDHELTLGRGEQLPVPALDGGDTTARWHGPN